MTNASPSAATVAARIRSLAIERGAYSVAGRLKPASIEAIAQRLAPDFMRDFPEANLIAALGRFSRQFPQHFFSQKEAIESVRKSGLEKKQPPNVPVSRTTREMLAQLSADQRLDFANTGELPKNFRSEDFQ